MHQGISSGYTIYESFDRQMHFIHPQWNRSASSCTGIPRDEGVRMLGNITAADEIFIVTGRTDMRKSIDGLCAIVEQQLHMDPRQSAHFIFFVANAVIESKHYFGKMTVLYFFTKEWKHRAGFAGLEISLK